MNPLQNDIKGKINFKKLKDTSWSKIILVDNKKLTEKGRLLTEILLNALLNDNNPNLVLPAEARPRGTIRIASQKAAGDLRKILLQMGAGEANFRSTSTSGVLAWIPLTRWSEIYTMKKDFADDLSRGLGATTNDDNYTFINPTLNLNIHTVRLDGLFFTFIRSDDGSGFKRGKIRNLEVFKFLRDYAGDYEFEVVYPAGETFDASELPASANTPQISTPIQQPTPTPPPTNPNFPKLTKNEEMEVRSALSFAMLDFAKLAPVVRGDFAEWSKLMLDKAHNNGWRKEHWEFLLNDLSLKDWENWQGLDIEVQDYLKKLKSWAEIGVIFPSVSGIRTIGEVGIANVAEVDQKEEVELGTNIVKEEEIDQTTTQVEVPPK